jgi:hypothetical protein
LAGLYGQATGLINQFNTGQNLHLAEAAQRQAAALAAQAQADAIAQAAAGGGGGGGGGGEQAPAAPTWTNPVPPVYQPAAQPGAGNLYGTLDPGIAGSLINASLQPAPAPKPKAPVVPFYTDTVHYPIRVRR